VTTIELSFGLFLVVLLVALAIFFAWRQRLTLTLLKPNSALGPDDRRFLHGQVRRRLCCCFLMVVFAGFLVGWLFLHQGFDELRPETERLGAGPKDELPEEVKESLRFYTVYWIGALLVLLGMIGLAALDMFATARYGLRRHRQLQDDRHAMLALEVAKMRQRRVERN